MLGVFRPEIMVTRSVSPQIVAIADPFPEEAELYELALASAGFRLHQLPTQDTPAALERVIACGAQLVITRVLPRRSGIELVQSIRSSPTTSAVPVLVLTGYTDHKLHEEARRAGANEVMLLPVMPDELIDRARSLIAS